MNSSEKAKQLLAEIGDLFAVEDITTDYEETGAFRFRGQLQLPEKEAYQKLNQRMEPFGLIPILRREDGQDVLVLSPHRPVEASTAAPTAGKKYWINLVLFIATVFSVIADRSAA